MTNLTNTIDTVENVKTLIVKVKALIKKTAGVIKSAWQDFLQECENFIYMFDVEVIELGEKSNIIGKGTFARKINNVNEFLDWSEYDWKVRVHKIVKLNDNKFNEFSNSCLNYYPFFDGMGGTGSLIDFNKRFEGYGDFDKMTWFEFQSLWEENEEIKNAWYANCCEECILIINKSTGEQILSSPQGYGYSRYTSFDFSLTTK